MPIVLIKDRQMLFTEEINKEFKNNNLMSLYDVSLKIQNFLNKNNLYDTHESDDRHPSIIQEEEATKLRWCENKTFVWFCIFYDMGMYHISMSIQVYESKIVLNLELSGNTGVENITYTIEQLDDVFIYIEKIITPYKISINNINNLKFLNYKNRNKNEFINNL